MRDNARFWDERSKVYDAQVTVTYADAYDKTVARTLPYLTPGDRVLDFACGTGIVTERLAGVVSGVVGVDTSARMLAYARERTARFSNVELRHGTLYDDALVPGSFDAVAAFNVLCYLPEGGDAVRRIFELLRPGGVFLSATDCLGEFPTTAGIRKWIRSHTGKMPYVRFFRLKGLERFISSAGFEILETANLHPAPPNLFVAARRPESKIGLEEQK